jgi:hypothetical protein
VCFLEQVGQSESEFDNQMPLAENKACSSFRQVSLGQHCEDFVNNRSGLKT